MNKVEIGDEVCSVIVPTMIGKVIDISSHGLLKVQIKTADGTQREPRSKRSSFDIFRVIYKSFYEEKS